MVNLSGYECGPFVGVFTGNRPLGELLWRLLNSPESAARLEMVTELKQPAVAGVQRPLYELLGDAIDDDGVRSMIGHMIRQVMDRLGYEPEKSGVKVRDFREGPQTKKRLFTVGTRYRRKPGVPKAPDFALSADEVRLAESLRDKAFKNP